MKWKNKRAKIKSIKSDSRVFKFGCHSVLTFCSIISRLYHSFLVNCSYAPTRQPKKKKNEIALFLSLKKCDERETMHESHYSKYTLYISNTKKESKLT